MLKRELFDNLMGDIEADYLAATEHARNRRDSAMFALNQLWLSHGEKIDSPAIGAALPVAETPAPIQPEHGTEQPSISDAVREAVDAVDQPFTRASLMAWLVENRPQLSPQERETSVLTALTRMLGKTVEISEQGAGRRPSKYQTLNKAHEASKPSEAA